ncbi:MAG: hypothetical protein WC675_03810 [Patescibacteria group bacterium]|jgi:hypothetical protein
MSSAAAVGLKVEVGSWYRVKTSEGLIPESFALFKVEVDLEDGWYKGSALDLESKDHMYLPANGSGIKANKRFHQNHIVERFDEREVSDILAGSGFTQTNF